MEWLSAKDLDKLIKERQLPDIAWYKYINLVLRDANIARE